MDLYEFRGRGESRVDPAIEDLAHACIGAAIEVHRELGPGLPEVAYLNAMARELTLRGIPHEVEARFPIFYKGEQVAVARVDILVDQRLVLELKSVELLTDVHRSQAIVYLQALKLPLA